MSGNGELGQKRPEPRTRSRGALAWLGSYFSYALTGYGVQLRWPIGIMIVTFTTSPPDPSPAGLVTGTTAMIQTFGSTLLIVLLGYVLGNLEQ